MKSIKDYVLKQSEMSDLTEIETIDLIRIKAAKHLVEADRLFRKGDSRQADTHASISLTYLGTALSMMAHTLSPK